MKNLTKEQYLEFTRNKLKENKESNKNKLLNFLFITNKLTSDILSIIESNEYQTIQNQYVISDNELGTFITPHLNKVFEWVNKLILHYKTEFFKNPTKTYEEILKEEEKIINDKWEKANKE